MVVIQNSTSGVTFAVKVHPRAKKNAITGEVGDALKVALTAAPVDGKANEAFAIYRENAKKRAAMLAGVDGAANAAREIEALLT